MANTIELKQQIAQGEYDAAFAKLYGADAVQEQRKRYTDLIEEFEKKYGTNRTVRLYSAPGRTEIGGNHTDHNNGVVLAGSVNLDMVAVVSPNEEMSSASSPWALTKLTMSMSPISSRSRARPSTPRP